MMDGLAPRKTPDPDGRAPRKTPASLSRRGLVLILVLIVVAMLSLGAYSFTDLQSFLDIYYQAAAVLCTPEDFYDLMTAYLDRAAADGVRHAEIFFDPQTHTARGVGFEVFMRGFRDAVGDARRRLGISVDLILCFLRHLSGDDALATMDEAEPFLEGVVAVGLAVKVGSDGLGVGGHPLAGWPAH